MNCSVPNGTNLQGKIVKDISLRFSSHDTYMTPSDDRSLKVNKKEIKSQRVGQRRGTNERPGPFRLCRLFGYTAIGRFGLNTTKLLVDDLYMWLVLMVALKEHFNVSLYSELNPILWAH